MEQLNVIRHRRPRTPGVSWPFPLAAFVIAIVVGLGLITAIVYIGTHSTYGGGTSGQRAQTAVTVCENSARSTIGYDSVVHHADLAGATFSRESFNASADPTWLVVGQLDATNGSGRHWPFTCTLQRSGEIFTTTDVEETSAS